MVCDIKDFMFDIILFDLQEELKIISYNVNFNDIKNDIRKFYKTVKYKYSWVYKNKKAYVIFDWMNDVDAEKVGLELSKHLNSPLYEWFIKDCDDFVGIQYEFDVEDICKCPPIDAYKFKIMTEKYTSILEIIITIIRKKHEKKISNLNKMV